MWRRMPMGKLQLHKLGGDAYGDLPMGNGDGEVEMACSRMAANSSVTEEEVVGDIAEVLWVALKAVVYSMAAKVAHNQHGWLQGHNNLLGAEGTLQGGKMEDETMVTRYVR